LLSLLLLVLVLFASLVEKKNGASLDEDSGKNNSLSNDLACETTYDQPADVVWEGEIVAQMVSGTQYAVRRIPEDKEYPFFYAGQDVDKAWA